MYFRERSCFRKSSKQDGCYLVLLKAQYRSSHIWIFLKAQSLDYQSHLQKTRTNKNKINKVVVFINTKNQKTYTVT